MQAAELTPQERRLEITLHLFSLTFLGMALIYLPLGWLGSADFPFVANSVAKDGLFAVLCLIAAGDVRQNGWAGLLVIGGHVLIVASLLFMLVVDRTLSVSGTFGEPLGISDPTVVLVVWLGLATGLIALLSILYHSAGRARYSLRWMWPHQHRTAMAMAEVLVIGDDEVLTPEQVAAGIDEYFFSFSAHEKWKAKFALSVLTIYPLFRLKPPFALISPARRLEFIERCFVNDVVERRLPGFLRRPVQSMLFAAQQMTIIGYYGDPRAAESTGFVPFSKRPRYAKAVKKLPSDRPSLVVNEPSEVDAERINADVAIIGSGAAGAVLAHRLAERGREVVLLEGGKHVDPRDFTEDERVQLSNLYADGAIQMSKDARFSVLQGKCVGGSTVVNNAVCLEIPSRTLQRWNDPDGLDAGIDEKQLMKSFKRLREWLPVSGQKNTHLQAGGNKMTRGLEELGLGTPPVVHANIKDCLGSGYCNMGCAYGKKLSALDNILPRAQAEYGDGVRIFSECVAERIKTSGGRASEVLCRLSDGRQLRIAANTVVVAGGALASSLLLQRSGLGGELAGTGLSFNVGAPLTADFEQELHAYDGLQITHTFRPPGEDQLILETWFNPVGTQAMLMPGWFSDHFHNMRRYAHLTCIGVVVGSQRNGRVKPGFRGRGMKLEYEPTEADLRLMIKGTKLAARIFFAARAMRVMPMTFRSLSFSSLEQVDQLDEVVRDNTDITLHTSHPQGGNAVSRDPAKGVVDERFKLHGTDNVYVCDASVFPSSVTVNPQLTVMALADYAAPNIE
ncbi:MAG: GMC family oxidoreductase N-terminal domain-containing protein [Solirubrobacterales bacterium]